MRNPNRRLKSLWDKDYFPEMDNEGRAVRRNTGGRMLAPELRDKPMSIRCLLLIPKNLVYILIFIICFSFAAMCYITYNNVNLKEFVKWGKLERQDFEVHDLFKKL